MTEITKVETRRVPLQGNYLRDERPVKIVLPPEFLAQIEADNRRLTAIGAGEKFALAWRLTTKLIPFIFQIFLGVIMGNWKTTLTAVIAALVAVFAHFGLNVSVEIQGIILSIGLALVGFFAKDATGAPESAPPPTYGRKP